MLRHFARPAPAEYLAMHSGEYVITVRLPLGDHDDQYQMICGTRGELEDITEEHDTLCPACF